MKNTKVARSASVILLALLLGSTLVWAQDTSGQPAPSQPDNTTVNRRDRKSTAPTADAQKQDSADRKITQQIRQSILKDKSLSTYAHNVKIISQNGQVTLKGPVRTEEEKQAIEMKAIEVAGENNVNSQLDVKSK